MQTRFIKTHFLLQVNKASDLDEVIKSHQKFLDTIFKRSLLDSENRDLLNQLRGIFDSVHELRIFLKEFNERVEVEVQNRKSLEPNTEEGRSAQKQFFASYVMQAKGKIETLYTTTQVPYFSVLCVSTTNSRQYQKKSYILFFSGSCSYVLTGT